MERTQPKNRSRRNGTSNQNKGSNRSLPSSARKVRGSRKGGSRTARIVRRRELIGTFTFTAADQFIHPLFEQSKCLINPGNEFLFPWGSRLAGLYEKYRFESLAFEAVTKNPSTCPGGVYLAVDTDPNDPVPASLSFMMHNRNASTGPAWQTCRLAVDVRSLNEGMPWRFTSPIESLDAYEPRTSFCGQLLFAGAGATATYEQTYDLYSDYTLILDVEQLTDVVPQIFEQGTTTVPAVQTYNNPTTLSGVSGPVRTVMEGVGSVPLFSGGPGIGGFTRPIVALDLGSVQTGALTYEACADDAGLTPYQLLPAGAIGDFAIHSQSGVYLGNATVLGTTMAGIGANKGSTWAAGQGATATLSALAEELRLAYPALRYVLPYLYTGATTAITRIGHKIKVLDTR
jgi:hypothetical protein